MQLFAADRRINHGSKKEETLRRPKQEKANADPQADAGPGARGAHSGESYSGTDVDTEGSSRTKRLLSPGGTPQDAQSQVKHTKQKQKEIYNS